MAGVIKMINHYLKDWKLLFAILLSLSLVAPLASASDVFYYSFSGNILGLKRNAIRIDDGFYTYSPTVKVFKENGEKDSTSNLKLGDFVQLTIQVMDNKSKRRVDTIKRLPDPNK
jgi:hypothetical protein